MTPEKLRADPSNMRKLLLLIDATYGPGDAVVRACGVSGEQIEALRDQLLEN